MTVKKAYIKSGVCALALMTGATILASMKLLERVIHPKTVSVDISYKQVQENKPLAQFINQLKKEPFTLTTKKEERLSGMVFMQEDAAMLETNKVVILLHGVTVNRYTSYKYIPSFYKEGYHVVCYDHAHHGLSSGKMTTLGYNESDDVLEVIKYCKKRFGETCIIGLHGESMGASTGMMTIGKTNQVDFLIEDCGFSSMRRQLEYRLKVEYHLPSFPIIQWTSLMLNYRYGINMNRNAPIDVMKTATIPTLFIHGSADTYVPTEMARQLYRAKKGKKKLVLFEGAAHARSVHEYPNAYEEVVHNFLKEYGF